MISMLTRAKAAKTAIAALTTEEKNAALAAMADALEANQDAILAANQMDLDNAPSTISPVMIDRLALSPARIAGMAQGIRDVAMDGAVDLLHAVRDGTDVVLVAVGDEHAAQLALVLHQIGEIGDDRIDAVHVLVGEAHAAVDDDHVLAILQNGDVLADLIQAAQRDNFQFFSQNMLLSMVACQKWTHESRHPSSPPSALYRLGRENPPARM